MQHAAVSGTAVVPASGQSAGAALETGTGVQSDECTPGPGVQVKAGCVTKPVPHGRWVGNSWSVS